MSSDSSPSSGASSPSPGDQILAEESEIRPDDSRNDDSTASATAPTSPSTLDRHPGRPTPGTETGTATAPIEISIDDDAPDTAASSSSPSKERAQTVGPGGLSKQLRNGDGLFGQSDGRLRNPVPSKLLDKAKKKDGSFAVMRVGASQRPHMDARDLAAKRSSEATQAAAMNAVKDGYQSLKRSKYLWKPQRDEPPPQLRQPYGYYPHFPHIPPSPSYRPPRPQGPPQPQDPAPNDVKAEQARLLTFLRSLHPVLVVDQLCKALAYFGGIPGAPPPPDQGGFPQSDRNNGSGALIVGWLSEIFPPADLPPSSKYPGGVGGPLGTDAGEAGNVTSSLGSGVPGRRPRGRPKGSKSSKSRKDKGIKKGPKVPPEGQVAGPDGTSTQPMPVDDNNRPAEAASSSQPPQSSDQPPEASQDAQPNAVAPSAAGEPQVPDSSVLTTPGPKKRGRPKGSKNRPRHMLDLRQSQSGSNNTAPRSQDSPTPNAARAAAHGSNPQHQHQHQQAYSTSQNSQRAVSVAEATLSQHAQIWSDPPPQSPRSSGQPNERSTGDTSRKRVAPVDDSTREGNQPQGQSQQQQQTRRQLPEGAQGPRSKRRRISEPQSSPATRNPDPQSPAGNVVAISRPGSGHMTQRPIRPSPQQQFQQPQKNHSPTIHPANQGQQNDRRSQSNTSGSFSQQPAQQQSQSQPQPQHQSYYNSQHRNHVTPTASSSSASASYPSFGDNQYLSMQYALSANRAVQQGNPPSSFAQQAQLDATMPDPQMQERLFSTYGKR